MGSFTPKSAAAAPERPPGASEHAGGDAAAATEIRIRALKRISIDNFAPALYRACRVKSMARKQARAERRPSSSRQARAPRLPREGALVRAFFLAALALLFLYSCQSPDPVAREKERTLTPDERYLVDYYMKIIEFEKLLHDNPATREEKRKELDENLDRERIRRTLAELEKKPEAVARNL